MFVVAAPVGYNGTFGINVSFMRGEVEEEEGREILGKGEVE